MKTEENIFRVHNIKNTDSEYFETLFEGKIRIEKIISSGHTTPKGKWYDQDEDEWVILVQGQATILFFDNEEVNLKAGNYLLIPKHRKHRVTHTSDSPPCIWLAIHGLLNNQENKL
ncbi:MAG: cupin domain-containing protein [Lentimicrobium sp.]|nr:cupin domain-containing protein [Lentimicrobium sp.]